jgi:predicted ATPase
MSQGLSPTSQSVALHFAAMVFQLCRNTRRARECAEASAGIASEHGFPFWLAGGTILGGWALAAGGDTQAGVDRLRQGLDEWRATGSVTYMTYYLGLLAESLQTQGDWEVVQQVLGDAMALSQRTDERMIEPELYRMRGEIRLQLGARDSSARSHAEADFRQALDIARRQEAKSLELRAAIGLTQLQDRLGISGDGRERLARALDSFTEGFETPDLKQARAYLAGLSVERT